MANPPTIALRRSRSRLRHPSGVSRRSRPWQWLALLGLVSGSCLCLPVLVPTPAHAYVARMEITLDRLPDETYDTLLRRAESVARAAAQRGFDRDVLVSELSIVVMAQNRGLTAPILALRVSRMQWSHRPDAGLWITYFRTARDLLGLGGMSQPTATPPTAPPPTPPAPVSTPQPAATPPTAPPAASPTPAASETPAASPTPAETNEASPSPPPTQPQQRPLVIPQGSGVPRIPTLPPL